MPKACKFCETLNWEIGEDIKNDLEHEYTVALVSHYIGRNEDGTWTRRGRCTDYRYRGLGYKLKFCPECGRKIKYEIRKRQQKKQAEREKEEICRKEEASQKT